MDKLLNLIAESSGMHYINVIVMFKIIDVLMSRNQNKSYTWDFSLSFKIYMQHFIVILEYFCYSST